MGGAFKMIAPSRARREIFLGISCEKSRFYAKKSYFFPILGRVRPLDPPLDMHNFVLYIVFNFDLTKWLATTTSYFPSAATTRTHSLLPSAVAMSISPRASVNHCYYFLFMYLDKSLNPQNWENSYHFFLTPELP